MNAPPADAPEPAHRTDLEGLRGLAVLSVFAVHTLPDAIAGGFIGVDVFFVLSGYLIARLTLREAAGGRFDAWAFYGRRLHRLVPALAVVLAANLAFAAAVAFPRDTLAIGGHVLAGAAFLSNVALWREAGYFDPSSQMKPLLHLWSLGVEAQYYVFWPVLAAALVRWPRRGLALVALALAVSLALNLAWVDSRPKATFFLPFTRAWELLAGALLACVEARRATAPRPTAGHATDWRSRNGDLMSWAGLGLIGVALGMLDKTASFPGAWALLPVAGTVLLIAAGPTAWLNRRVLTHPVLGFYGRISYPLYLWHYPLLVWPRLLAVEPTLLGTVALLGIAVLAAALTERYVERGWRAAGAAGRHAAVATLIGLATAGLVLARGNGWLDRVPEPLRAVAESHARFDHSGYREGLCFLRDPGDGPERFDPRCWPSQASQRPAAVLWGDSHAAALYLGLREAMALERPSWGLGQLTAAACPPLPAGSGLMAARCDAINTAVLARLEAHPPRVVMLAGSWSSYAPAHDPDAVVRAVASTVRLLRSAGVQAIVIIGPLPHWRVEPPRRLLAAWRLDAEPSDRVTDGVNPLLLDVDAALRRLAIPGGVSVVAPLDDLCEPTGCRHALRSGALWHAVSFDASHLTTEGSREVARQLWPRMADAFEEAGAAPTPQTGAAGPIGMGRGTRPSPSAASNRTP